ncbi:glutamine--fructose-6-phosphate transaminase (isomerizing) [Arcanobacterium phocisimile]|uniref:Glutamine--fructose-6-phosphate aminotransferase [isomerizing] n=1 Tax=Arcanobacterium phocisimile TaxID=1302235 RepID=A0ABX7II67_9ACTO|nr:glutamine--fructose-6-phosphate transaminase (isomerizing) [Arcanobacterium phocisimile]QRV01805.1 glutamine--fructose-6-phosphate transaminase (isomerizing) [Arcanobacterium phocisimile]
MCGIVGYIGAQTSSTAQEVVLSGLERLEYRGYDSAGVAVLDGECVAMRKRAGRVADLRAVLAEEPLAQSPAAIGHTRWATHGIPSDRNSHPHLSADGRVAIVHNGIIENAPQLRNDLIAQGIEFASDTDSEVIAHMLGKAVAERGDLTQAMLGVVARLEGSFAVVATYAGQPDRLVGARRNSPLVVGLGDEENFFGSDVVAFVGRTKEAMAVGQDQIVTLTAHEVTVTDFAGNQAHAEKFSVDWNLETAMHDGYPTFMDKEIHEQPSAVAETLRGRTTPDGHLKLDELRIEEYELRAIDKIIVVACGTAAYAGHVAKYAIEHWCRIPVEVELAHEFRYRDPIVTSKTLVVAISQSGETMDTLMAVRHASEQGARVLAIVNTYASTIAREADAVLYTHAGPEIAVASTKAFTAQITATYLLGLYLAQLRGNKFVDEIAGYLEELHAMPQRMEFVLEQEEQIRELARTMAEVNSVLFLGRHVGFPIALEGALKLKELAYIHAEGFAAGELKHGPIALVEDDLPIFVIAPTPRRPLLHSKVMSNIHEVIARGARAIVIAEEGDSAVDDHATAIIRVPHSTPTLMMPLVTVIPLQIFASELASVKGFDVDKPRNLAKSVTVD